MPGAPRHRPLGQGFDPAGAAMSRAAARRCQRGRDAPGSAAGGTGWLGFDGLPDEAAYHLWSIARRAAQDDGRDPGRADGLPGRCARVPSRGLARLRLRRWRVFPVVGHQRHAGPHLQLLQGMQVNQR
jgi:hypothetical protein